MDGGSMHDLEIDFHLRVGCSVNLMKKLRNGDVLVDRKRLVDAELKAFDWVDFTVEEQEVFGLAVQWADVESDPLLLGDSMVVGVEFWLAESSWVHPHPFPIPSAASEPIKRTLGLVCLGVESTHFLLVSLILNIKVHIIESDSSVSISTETLKRNDTISDDSRTLVVSSDVCVVGSHLNIFLEDSDVESCRCLCVSVSANALYLTDVELEVFLLNVHVEGWLVEIFGKGESDLLLDSLVSDIVSPVVDLDQTAVTQVNEVDFEFVQIVLDEKEPVDFLATKYIKTIIPQEINRRCRVLQA